MKAGYQIWKILKERKQTLELLKGRDLDFRKNFMVNKNIKVSIFQYIQRMKHCNVVLSCGIFWCQLLIIKQFHIEIIQNLAKNYLNHLKLMKFKNFDQFQFVWIDSCLI